jgi:NADH-quinone oxidoreductase subunit I
MVSIVNEAAETVAGIAKAMAVTLTETLSPAVTEDYPDGPPHFEGRYRGVHALQRDENGLEKCVACFLCAVDGPAYCIYIEAADNTGQERFSASERYTKVYNIDYNRRLFCGYCVGACPTDAITHGHGFENASYNTVDLISRKERLLARCPRRSPSCVAHDVTGADRDKSSRFSEAAHKAKEKDRTMAKQEVKTNKRRDQQSEKRRRAVHNKVARRAGAGMTPSSSRSYRVDFST